MILIKERSEVTEYGELVKTLHVYLDNTHSTIEEAEDYALGSYRMWIIQHGKK
jgi:hypothetical protein